jgi:hypothetical protein
MDASFEVNISHDVDISMYAGSTIIPRGLYMVTLLHNKRGRKDSAARQDRH